MEFIRNAIGTSFFAFVVFVVGALIGQPLWKWILAKLPFSK
jgi:hypothetical protein